MDSLYIVCKLKIRVKYKQMRVKDINVKTACHKNLHKTPKPLDWDAAVT